MPYNPAQLEHIFRQSPPIAPFPPASDREAWTKALPTGDAAQIIASAEAVMHQIPVMLPATLYLEVKRTGQREGYDDAVNEREAALTALVLAECIEYRGRFLDAILNYAWAICEESSWAYPAHQYELADMDRPVIDLGAAGRGWMLAEIDALLGDVLEPMLRKRIRYEVNRRLFVPYLSRNDFHWLYNAPPTARVHNWTAVCSAGIIGAAMALETDISRLAQMVDKALRSLNAYLDSFDRDGGTSEGPGYWAYGFGHFVMLAHLLEQRTRGQIALLDGDRMRAIGTFPLRTRLSPGVYVNFSDSSRGAEISASLLAYLAWRLDTPALLNLTAEQPVNENRHKWFITARREIFWRGDVPDKAVPPAKRDWFSEMQWLIARSDGDMVLAVKGGHNDELHNHNDVGSFIVHVRGESLIADPGAARYTRDYFNEKRYTFFAAQSVAHSVPVVNGQAQGQGRQFAAELLNFEATDTFDRISFELKQAYPPEADLGSLKRTLMLHRDSASVELVDEFEFATDAHEFECVLITLSRADILPDAVVISGEHGRLRIEYDTEVVTPRLDIVEQVDLDAGLIDVTRIIFAVRNAAKTGMIRVMMY